MVKNSKTVGASMVLGSLLKSHVGTFRYNGYLLGVGLHGCVFINIHYIVHLGFMQFNVCKFYLKCKINHGKQI